METGQFSVPNSRFDAGLSTVLAALGGGGGSGAFDVIVVGGKEWELRRGDGLTAAGGELASGWAARVAAVPVATCAGAGTSDAEDEGSSS